MIQDTSVSEILAYILAAIFVGYSLRTPALMYDITSWVTLGAAMGFAMVGVIIRIASKRKAEEELTELPAPVKM
jgi:hypothetical protein